MKKNILIAMLTIIAIAAIIFSVQQKQKADNFQNLAEVNAREIQLMKDHVEISRIRAEELVRKAKETLKENERLSKEEPNQSN